MISAEHNVSLAAMVLTYRFKSSSRTSGLTPTRFRSILAIISSRKITSSWSQNLILQGFDPRCTLGILAFNLVVRDDSSGLRGRIELTVMSRGPGTSTKCVCLVIRGYDDMRSARESKPSERQH